MFEVQRIKINIWAPKLFGKLYPRQYTMYYTHVYDDQIFHVCIIIINSSYFFINCKKNIFLNHNNIATELNFRENVNVTSGYFIKQVN